METLEAALEELQYLGRKSRNHAVKERKYLWEGSHPGDGKEHEDVECLTNYYELITVPIPR